MGAIGFGGYGDVPDSGCPVHVQDHPVNLSETTIYKRVFILDLTLHPGCQWQIL